MSDDGQHVDDCENQNDSELDHMDDQMDGSEHGRSKRGDLSHFLIYMYYYIFTILYYYYCHYYHYYNTVIPQFGQDYGI